MFHLKQCFIISIWTHLHHLSFFASLFEFFSFILTSCPQIFFYPGTVLHLGRCRWTEEVLHEQRKDHHREQQSVTALTTVWPTDQQGLSSGTHFLTDTPSLVQPLWEPLEYRSQEVSCGVFHHFFTLLYLVMYKAWGDEKRSENCRLMENNGAERE